MANMLANLSERYQYLYNRIKILSDASSDYWKGEASEEFKTEIQRLQSEARSLGTEIHNLSSLIKKTALEVQAEEAD